MISTTVTYDQIVKAHSEKQLEILQRLGIDTNNQALVCDGKIGPKTRGATYLNPDLFIEAAEARKNAPCGLTPWQVALFIKAAIGHAIHPSAIDAFNDLWDGKGETHGNNRGPYISELYEDDNPEAQQGAWCGMALRKWIRAAYPDAIPVPKKSWLAKGVVRQLKKVVPAYSQSGDALVFNRKVNGSSNNGFGHATLIVVRDGDTLWTIEGNVDIRPGVDGVGARSYSIKAGIVNRSGETFYMIGRVA